MGDDSEGACEDAGPTETSHSSTEDEFLGDMGNATDERANLEDSNGHEVSPFDRL